MKEGTKEGTSGWVGVLQGISLGKCSTDASGKIASGVRDARTREECLTSGRC